MVLEGLPPKASYFEVTDASSDLFDQLSLLWGTVSFKNMMDPDNSSNETHIAYKSVFDGNPFPAPMSQTGMPGPFDLMMGVSKVIFMNLMAMHFNQAEGTFVNTSGLNGGAPTPGDEISTVNAGYITMVLAQFTEEFVGTALGSAAENALNAQANFIVSKLKDASGGFYNSYTIGMGSDSNAKTAVSQAAVARGLYAAYVKTGITSYLDAANAAYQYLIDNYYVASQMAFRTEEGAATAVYTPFNFAVIVGALREGHLVGNHTEAAMIYARFFKKVANVMQLSEGMASGETGSDSDDDGIPFIPEQDENLPPIFAAEATLDLAVTGIFNFNKTNNDEFGLKNYPNPFSNSTSFEFTLSSASDINLEIFNVNGQMRESIYNNRLSSGGHIIHWDASGIPAGIYYYKLSNGERTAVKKTMKIR
jgi:hypothetical protein